MKILFEYFRSTIGLNTSSPDLTLISSKFQYCLSLQLSHCRSQYYTSHSLRHTLSRPAGPAAGTRAVLDQDKKYRMSEVAAGPAVPALTVRRYLPISSDESGTDEAEGERYSGIARVGTGPILSTLNGSGLDWGAKPKVIVRRAGADGMVGRVVPAPKTARQLAAEARHAARLSTAQQTRTAEPRPLPPVRIAPAAGQSLPAPARSHAVNLGPLTPTIAARCFIPLVCQGNHSFYMCEGDIRMACEWRRMLHCCAPLLLSESVAFLLNVIPRRQTLVAAHC